MPSYEQTFGQCGTARPPPSHARPSRRRTWIRSISPSLTPALNAYCVGSESRDREALDITGWHPASDADPQRRATSVARGRLLNRRRSTRTALWPAGGRAQSRRAGNCRPPVRRRARERPPGRDCCPDDQLARLHGPAAGNTFIRAMPAGLSATTMTSKGPKTVPGNERRGKPWPRHPAPVGW